MGALGGGPTDAQIAAARAAVDAPVVLKGTDDGGNTRFVPLTAEGHLEVDIHGPRTAFGEVRTAEATPMFDGAFPYVINPQIWKTSTKTGGTISAADGQATVQIDTTANADAVLESRQLLHYRMGRGALARWTAVLPAGVANAEILAGPINEESGWAFGCRPADGAFGILHRKGGKRAIRTLTVSVGAGGSETATVTLNGVTKAVSLVAGSTTATALQLSKADYSATGNGWDAEAIGATVVFISRRAEAFAGGFTLTSTGTAAGTFANTRAGVAPTDTWTLRADWLDPMTEGVGSTGVVLDPTKGNVYETAIQYLGYGPVVHKVEYQPSGTNNPAFAVVDVLDYLNQNTTPSVGNPSTPWRLQVRSKGSTSALQASVASVFLAVEGNLGYPIEVVPVTGVTSSLGGTEIPIVTIRNPHAYGGAQSNRTGTQLTHVTVGWKGGSNVIATVRAYRNATLTGASFAAVDATRFAAYADTSATAVTGGTKVFEQRYVESTNIREDVTDKRTLFLAPGEEVTLTGQASSGTNGVMSISVECIEWQ